MPFDSLTSEPDVAVVARFKAAPTLKDLAVILRDRRLWPTEFGPWNYSSSETCAIGLMRTLGGVRAEGAIGREAGPAWDPVFMDLLTRSEVRPEDVADAIERVLARRRGV